MEGTSATAQLLVPFNSNVKSNFKCSSAFGGSQILNDHYPIFFDKLAHYHEAFLVL
jgi:hypothetical protein